MHESLVICLVIGMIVLLYILFNLKTKNKNLQCDLNLKIKEELLYLSLFDTGDATLFKWRHDQDWSIENVSLSVEKLLGHSREDFMSSKIVYASCIHEEDLAYVTQEVLEATKVGIKYFKHEPYRIITKDACIKWVLDYTTVVRDESGEITHFIGVLSDITTIKQRENELIKQSRLAQMGGMISMIAHQWRQPLGAISSTAIDLKMKIQLGYFPLDSQHSKEECLNYFETELNNIEECTRNLAETIDDFKDFYTSNKALKFVNVNEVILKAINIIKSSLYANNVSLYEQYESINKVEIYDSEIMQVILNIFKNTLDNFKLLDIKEGKIWVHTQDSDAGVTISICDNGGGIDEAIIEKIFDPYFSKKHENNGTGLGLYMSKMIILDHHNGSIEAVNKNGGVCFYIKLIDNHG